MMASEVNAQEACPDLDQPLPLPSPGQQRLTEGLESLSNSRLDSESDPLKHSSTIHSSSAEFNTNTKTNTKSTTTSSFSPLKPPIRSKMSSKHKTSLSITVPRNIDLPLSTFNSSLTAVDQSRELQNAYPDGPVLVCEPNIYLYSEPNAEVLKDYDVVINVAKEVCYPFKTKSNDVDFSIPSSVQHVQEDMTTDAQAYSSAASGLDNWIPPYSRTAVNECPGSSSVAAQEDVSGDPASSVSGLTCSTSASENSSACGSSSGNSSPFSDDCPLMTHLEFALPPISQNSQNLPLKPPDLEYVYVPWDHGSDLSNDLEPLINLISLRSLQNKRILIHCQCGVSRSASLIVAYVMKKLHYDLHTAYSYVKKRSPTISPNMKLMYQLMDWDSAIKVNKHGKRDSV